MTVSPTAPARTLPPAAARSRRARLPTSRSYLEIVRDNVFTFINAVLFGLALALIVLGRTSDALVSIGVVAVNMAVGLVQEIHAKRVLDRIAVLTRPRVTVARNGLQYTIDPAEVVGGDLLVATAGDQIVADGVVVSHRAAEVDEALLTGESDRVPKTAGDRVLAGTFCAGGTLEYVAEQVGAESTAARLATSARAFRRVLTPLQHEMNRVVRVSLVVVILFEILIALANALDRTSLVESVRMAVVIAGLIPNGLFLAIAVAYAMGAVRIAGKGALVQQANAVESLSHVDVLCLDKTGTLTTNGFKLAELLPLHQSELEFRAQLGMYAASSSDSNRTLLALRTELPAQPRPVLDEVLFSSARKWSALTVADASGPTTYVLGAADVLQPHLGHDEPLPHAGDEWVSRGLRVLMLARAPAGGNRRDDEPCLSDNLAAVGILALSDELRPEAAQTLAEFGAIGVHLALLSGDDPRTVAAVAQQAGMQCDTRMSGSELAALEPDTLADLALRGTIFGRLSPGQKKTVLKALRTNGHCVGMIGDGVNDVPALKAANLAIAMESGTAAARAVSDIVLLHDNFGSLPFALHEGQRIRGGMHSILKLFLTRVLYMALLIVMLAVLDVGFPFAPKQNALVTLLTVGLPTLALAARARPIEQRVDSSSVTQFVVPAACSMAIMGLAVYAGYVLLGPMLDGETAVTAINSVARRAMAQTALTIASILCGLLLIVFARPPDGEHSKRKHIFLALTLLLGLLLITMDPRLRTMFELQPLSLVDWLVLAGVAAVWGVSIQWIWRSHLLDRLLGLDATPQVRSARTPARGST